MSHTCHTGKHGWTDPANAERCCSGEWVRVQRPVNDCEDLDKAGRVYLHGLPFVHGWIRPPTTKQEESC